MKAQSTPGQKHAWWTTPYVNVPIDLSKGHSPVLIDINNNGLVVGTLRVPDGPNQVAVWQINPDNTTTCKLVGPAMVASLAPTAINDSGMVAGNYPGPYGFYSEGPDYENLIQLDDANLHGFNFAADVNNSGKITGNTRFGPENDRGIYKAMSYMSGAFTDLGVMPAIPGWLAPNGYGGISINQSSVIAGNFGSLDSEANFRQGAFIHRDGQLSRLPLPTGAKSSYPTDINDAGWVVGWVNKDELFKGFVWDPVNALADPYLPTDSIIYGDCNPNSINNENQIVGSAVHKIDMRNHAAFWEQIVVDPEAYIPEYSYYMYDLNCLLDGSSNSSLLVAKKINDLGQIIGETYAEGDFIIVPKNGGG